MYNFLRIRCNMENAFDSIRRDSLKRILHPGIDDWAMKNVINGGRD